MRCPGQFRTARVSLRTNEPIMVICEFSVFFKVNVVSGFTRCRLERDVGKALLVIVSPDTLLVTQSHLSFFKSGRQAVREDL